MSHQVKRNGYRGRPRPTGKVGAVMVVGAGVGGIQAALDAAASGFKVFLVDKGPAIGGKMSQLDKTFPTNDCSMCILSPKFIECATNPNITILTNTRVEGVEGRSGQLSRSTSSRNHATSMRKNARGAAPAPNTARSMSPMCTTRIWERRNASTSISPRQCRPYLSSMQASCLFLKRKICQICVPTCKSKAINFRMQPKRSDR